MGFSADCEKVIHIARLAAEKFNHEYLGTEHFLLGLVRLETSTAALVLKTHGIELARVQQEVEKIVKPGSALVTSEPLPYTPRMKNALDLAREEALRLGRTSLGTEHMLLGLLAENEGIAAQVLLGMGVSVDTARAIVLALGERGPETKPAARLPGLDETAVLPRLGIPIECFTGRMESVWNASLLSARMWNHDTLGTEHLLAGLLREPNGTAAHALRTLRLERERALTKLTSSIEKGNSLASLEQVHVGPGVRVALALAGEEAHDSGHQLIGTGHLLLGLLREEAGWGARTLRGMGVELESARSAVEECFRRIDDDPVWDLIG
jgi:ATP-dependent Clp protease ATP-binding subunit ClpA